MKGRGLTVVVRLHKFMTTFVFVCNILQTGYCDTIINILKHWRMKYSSLCGLLSFSGQWKLLTVNVDMIRIIISISNMTAVQNWCPFVWHNCSHLNIIIPPHPTHTQTLASGCSSVCECNNFY